jgi:hypothetical protein
MSIFLGLLLAAVLFLLAVSLVLFVIGPVLLLQPQRRTVEYYRHKTGILTPSDVSMPFEQLVLKTGEGINLSCWFLKASGNPKGSIVYLHGVSECKIVGLPLAQRLHQQGYNVFLYDSRRHGESGGQHCTYGFYEKHDVSTIIGYLERRADVLLGRIGLFGSSMGAAVAIQVAALNNKVAAVVAESGFATLRTIFDDYQKRMIKLPWHYLRNIVIRRSEKLAHFKASAVSPVDVIKRISVPIFILHGTEDRLIKYAYSEQLYMNANEPKQLWLIRGADHSNMAEIGGEEYYERILEFFERAFK